MYICAGNGGTSAGVSIKNGVGSHQADIYTIVQLSVCIFVILQLSTLQLTWFVNCELYKAVFCWHVHCRLCLNQR